MDERRITGISIYPIKSTAGISLDACEVQARGLAMDRRWMVVDDHGDFITAREFPILTQIRSTNGNDGLPVAAPGEDTIDVPFPGNAAPKMRVTIWDDECHATRAGVEVDAWFSRVLGIACRLVYMHDECKRPLEADYGRPGDHVSLADGYPLLLISSASLVDLNSRLEEPMSMSRFRPNLVVGGCAPFDEDEWREITIGDVEFEAAKRCSRCELTTIDPDNGERHPRLEPLRTLASYRRGSDGHVFFGRYLIARTPGSIYLDDAVRVKA